MDDHCREHTVLFVIHAKYSFTSNDIATIHILARRANDLEVRHILKVNFLRHLDLGCR